MRKFDKVYKLYDALEGKILNDYVKDEQIDPEEFMKQARSETELQMQKDVGKGMQMINQNKI